MSGTLTLTLTYPSDHRRWDHHAAHARESLEQMLLLHFGPRCHEHHDDCPICERWKALDALLDNPHPVDQ